MFSKFSKYYHTLKHLKRIQLQYRIYYLLRSRWRRLTNFSYPKKTAPTKARLLQLPHQIEHAESWQPSNTFRFLNLDHQFPEQIDWDYMEYGKLWAYNLNYFEFLLQPNLSKEEGLALISDYIAHFDQLKNGLEPFPISLRVQSWIKFLIKHQIKDEPIRHSLYTQLWILANHREYHLLGNHLLENGFGLLFGAHYFEDQALYQLARNILETELEEQILADGGHFELSPMYHQIMLYRVLDCIHLLKDNPPFGEALLPLLTEKAAKMLGWLQQMTFANGSIPLLNDSANSIAPNTQQLLSYAEKLAIQPVQQGLNESGYRRMDRGHFEVIADVGPIGPDYIPGHAHSDILSFEMQVDQQPFIVDTGLSTYEKNARRNLERATASHNTVQIGDWEQSEVWGGFRVARRAYTKIEKEEEGLLTASHNGYQRQGCAHRRTFELSADRLTISDQVTTTANHPAKAYLHFHPTVKVRIEEAAVVTSLGKIEVEGASDLQLLDYKYAPEFNIKEPAKKLLITFAEHLKTTISR